MKKILFLVLFGISFSLTSQAQSATAIVPDHTPMMNEIWEKINLLMYRVTKKGNENIYTPHFPPELKSLEAKIVELPGYLVPLNAGRNHSNFMISVLPIMQCSFCGTNDIPPMVEVFMKKGKSIKFTEEPLIIKGKVYLNSNMNKGNSEIQILEAELID